MLYFVMLGLIFLCYFNDHFTFVWLSFAQRMSRPKSTSAIILASSSFIMRIKVEQTFTSTFIVLCRV